MTSLLDSIQNTFSSISASIATNANAYMPETIQRVDQLKSRITHSRQFVVAVQYSSAFKRRFTKIAQHPYTEIVLQLAVFYYGGVAETPLLALKLTKRLMKFHKEARKCVRIFSKRKESLRAKQTLRHQIFTTFTSLAKLLIPAAAYILDIQLYKKKVEKITSTALISLAFVLEKILGSFFPPTKDLSSKKITYPKVQRRIQSKVKKSLRREQYIKKHMILRARKKSVSSLTINRERRYRLLRVKSKSKPTHRKIVIFLTLKL